jgi:ketosteroid isomerase-like protein
MIGSQQIKGLFENLFKKMSVNVQYTVDEVIINGDYAFVRTNSKGNNVVRASGENVPVDNKELFVVNTDNGEWKITHYIGNHN